MIFKTVFGSQQNWVGDTVISHTPLSSTHASPITNFHQSSILVTTDEPTLMHHNCPKSVVYIVVHPWVCIFCGFGHRYNDSIIINNYSIIQSSFTALKIIYAPFFGIFFDLQKIGKNNTESSLYPVISPSFP